MSERDARDKGLADYLAAMDRAGGGIYTADFRNGFRHALSMLAAYESVDQRAPVREAARKALEARPTVSHAEEPDHPVYVECCASGRCEVCTPGYNWGRDG